jgi:hypothetical protein
MAKNNDQAIEKRQTREELINAATADIEAIVSECGIVALSAVENPLVQSIKLADGLRRMRGIMNQSLVDNFFMPLQGSPLGFVTDKDKDKDKYSWDVVRDVLIEGMLRGFRPIGNELNIIAGRFYGAKAGFERIVDEYPGLRKLDYAIGVPRMVADKGALVEATASWELHGAQHTIAFLEKNEDGIDTRIAVRVNSGMGPDAIHGKATRKLFARIYAKLTRCSSDIVEMDPADYVDASAGAPAQVSAAPQGRRMSLKSSPEQPASDPEESSAPERESGED